MRGRRRLTLTVALLATMPSAASAGREGTPPGLLLNACAGTGRDTRYWEETIKDGDAAARARAATALGETRSADATPALVEALADGDANVRLSVVRALGRIGGDGAVDALTRALGDRSPEVQAAAARALEALRQRATR